MGSNFASGKFAIAPCDVCGFRYKLKQLKELVVKTKNTNILACPSCWVPDQPQLQLGMYVIVDPQAIRNPRPDAPDTAIQWGWDPVGYTDPLGQIQSTLEAVASLGTVTVTTSQEIIMARGNGIEKKGKSKATVKNTGPTVGIENGGKGSAGVSNEDRKTYGRNMARVMNQKDK